MKIICAWCGAVIADKPHLDSVARYPITQGICPTCRPHLIPTPGLRPLEQYLDRLEQPLIVVNSEGDVQFANHHALQFLGKTPPQVVGFKGGEVMECAYATLPEGCGNTTHCVACTIRENVRRTFESGEALLRVPAYLTRRNGHGTTTLDFLISTEKIGDVVLLRIDEVL